MRRAMCGRRDILKGLLALLLLPAGLGRPAAASPVAGFRGAASPGAGFRLVNGWVLTDRDVAALAALDRARH
jgi:hypothetical protein